MNSVAPEPDWSWIRPGTFCRFSALTGNTYLPERTVMMGSCRYLEKLGLWM